MACSGWPYRFISVHGLQKQCQGRHQSREVVEAAQAALRRLKDVQADGRIELWMHGYKMRGAS